MDCSSPGSSVQGFSRQESWSGLPCPFARDLPDTGISPHLLRLLYWQAGSLPLAPPGKRSIFSVCFFLQCNLDNKNSHLLVFILCQGFWLVLKKPCFISSSQQTRVHTCTLIFFFKFFFIIDYYKVLSVVPVLYSRSLLFIYFI